MRQKPSKTYNQSTVGNTTAAAQQASNDRLAGASAQDQMSRANEFASAIETVATVRNNIASSIKQAAGSIGR